MKKTPIIDPKPLDLRGYTNFDRAKSDASKSIDGAIMEYYTPRRWNNMSLKERYNIIEDTIRDINLGQTYGLSEKEITKIIKIEKSKEA